MVDASITASGFLQLSSQQLRSAVESFLPKGATREERVRAIEAGLKSSLGQSLRDAMARWLVDDIVPVTALVPQSYVKWRPPVRDAMMFVVARLSPARLAPKLLEQIELPPSTPAEVRLLCLIAKVPGLQKLGQVIARNRHLHPSLRRALAKLENGIRDVNPRDMRMLIEKALGPKVKNYAVEISSGILKEASVSAVVRFTWRNPETKLRQRGVFKVLKPHIPEYFAEDMDYLQGLAEYFGDRHHRYGFPAHLIPDTFQKVRRLLRHEVNFRREQKTLIEAGELYRSFSGVAIPQVIQRLCSSTLTALTEEKGIKVTNAASRLPASRRRRISEQLVEALIAVPLLSAKREAIFHGDPHAGNLLYDRRSGRIVILDWALRERFGRDERRHLALLFLMVSLRDPVGVSNEIVELSQRRIRNNSREWQVVQETVNEFLDAMPASGLASTADAMRLLENVAMRGIKFPGSLIILSKVMFTLEGVLNDISGTDHEMGFAIARQVARRWITNRGEFQSPLIAQDWFTLQCSAFLLLSRLGVRWEQTMLDRWRKPRPLASSATA